ncbi:uncharacterized protein LOC116255754 [Nymphaea colorata]|nr:uncharacterized protein LOC116255754 [Nymphaea colorata]XP_049934262.1 uncharacterized protein LOC116255754 [Nymphaea colorata]
MEGTPFLDGGREAFGIKSVDHHLGSKRTMILGSDQSNSSDGCRHFSIRGYVGEIRRLNRKICWPFSIYDNKDNLDKETERLPPLSVPKFKQWCCQKCSGCTGICLDDPKGDILEGTCDYNVKACAMHIELKIEHVSVDSREEYSRASNYESGCKSLLPISITSGIRKDEGQEHCVSEKKLESFVSSTTAATAIESVHLSDCFANAEGQEATETRHEEFTNALGLKALERKEKSRKKVAKRLVDRKQDELGQGKPVPDRKLENNLSSKLAVQEFSSRGFDKNSNFESDIRKSLGHINCGCDQEKNLELNRKNVPGKGKKNVKLDIDHNKHRDIISCSGRKDDQDAGSGSVVAEICYLNLGSSDCDSSGDDYCLEESKIFSPHNVVHQMQGHPSVENCGSRHSNDQFCLDVTACRRTQKTRLLSDIINECDMLAAMERASVSKRIAAMGSLKERIIPVKTSSEGSPTKSHVEPHEEFTESNEMNNKAASHIKVSDSTVGSSQDSLCSSSNKYEEKTKVQGCLEVHEKSNNCATEIPGDEQKDSETTIDEIPMDIVELMAKNQHERRLFHAAEHKSMNQLIDTCSKRAPSIMDITAVLENDVASLLDEDVSFSQNLEYTNARDKMFTDTRENVFTCVRKATEIESDQMGLSSVINRTDHMSACKRKLPPSTTDLSSEPCFPVSDHYMQNFIQESGWNKKATGCRWFPASIQPAQEYDMLHLAPMQSSMSMHKSPVGMQTTQTIKFESHCCSRDSDYLEPVVIAKGSGKMIDPGILDTKGMNSRAAPYQNRKEMVVSKTPEKIYPFSWGNNEVDYHPKDMLVSDLYKNEAISAVNLLRLVNRDTLSSALDKSCDESNACLMNKSLSFHNNQSNVSVVPVGYVNNISETSLHPMTPEGCDLNFPLRSVGRLLSPLTDVSGACSLQKDRPLDPDNRKMPFCSMGHFSSKVSLMMHKVMSYPSPPECDQECCSGSHKCTPFHCFDKKAQCSWDPVNISRHSQKRDQLSPFRAIEICGEKDAKPQFGASDSMMEICTLNRNPAEISMYEEEDGSSIVQPEFQKFGKLSPTRNRYWKRQKTVKLAAIKANI